MGEHLKVIHQTPSVFDKATTSVNVDVFQPSILAISYVWYTFNCLTGRYTISNWNKTDCHSHVKSFVLLRLSPYLSKLFYFLYSFGYFRKGIFFKSQCFLFLLKTSLFHVNCILVFMGRTTPFASFIHSVTCWKFSNVGIFIRLFGNSLL